MNKHKPGWQVYGDDKGLHAELHCDYLHMVALDGKVLVWDTDFRLATGKACSKPRVIPPKSSRLLPPGDWVAAVILALTFGMYRICSGCKSRMKKMNRAGWLGLPKLAAKEIWGLINGTK
jgi:hypothetical protein